VSTRPISSAIDELIPARNCGLLVALRHNGSVDADLPSVDGIAFGRLVALAGIWAADGGRHDDDAA
jgi:hypothetical protein